MHAAADGLFVYGCILGASGASVKEGGPVGVAVILGKVLAITAWSSGAYQNGRSWARYIPLLLIEASVWGISARREALAGRLPL